MIPDDLAYTAEHEWVKAEGEDTVRVGITDYAQQALGDIVFVDLPNVGDEIQAGTTFGEVESTKSVSELFAPIDGVVLEVNEDLADEPDLINSDAYGRGWVLRVSISNDAQMQNLLSASDYRALTEEQ